MYFMSMNFKVDSEVNVKIVSKSIDQNDSKDTKQYLVNQLVENIYLRVQYMNYKPVE